MIRLLIRSQDSCWTSRLIAAASLMSASDARSSQTEPRTSLLALDCLEMFNKKFLGSADREGGASVVEQLDDWQSSLLVHACAPQNEEPSHAVDWKVCTCLPRFEAVSGGTVAGATQLACSVAPLPGMHGMHHWIASALTATFCQALASQPRRAGQA